MIQMKRHTDHGKKLGLKKSVLGLLGLPSGFPLGMILPKDFDKRDRLVPHDSVRTQALPWEKMCADLVQTIYNQTQIASLAFSWSSGLVLNLKPVDQINTFDTIVANRASYHFHQKLLLEIVIHISSETWIESKMDETMCLSHQGLIEISQYPSEMHRQSLYHAAEYTPKTLLKASTVISEFHCTRWENLKCPALSLATDGDNDYDGDLVQFRKRYINLMAYRPSFLNKQNRCHPMAIPLGRFKKTSPTTIPVIDPSILLTQSVPCDKELWSMNIADINMTGMTVIVSTVSANQYVAMSRPVESGFVRLGPDDTRPQVHIVSPSDMMSAWATF
ncbi:hypothetical protein Tco_1568311 [Tanacetum coccineum]